MFGLYYWFFPQKSKTKMYYLSLLKNSSNENGYSLHGLWPDYGDGTYPSFCRTVSFDINQLKSIERDLLKYWELPRDHDKLEVSFWKHEWLKHGSCMFQEMNEFIYFNKALELYKSFFNGEHDIHQYKKGRNYMIPFDLDFNIIT